MTASNHPSKTNSKRHRISTKYLVRIQAVSGAIFLVFLLLHICNTLLASLGPEVYDSYQGMVQSYYQNPVVEPVFVIFPLFTHAAVGILLFFRRRPGRKQGLTLAKKLHSWSGLFLLIVVFGHVAATRGIALYANTSVGFDGVAFTFAWMPYYFYPYYFLLFMAGFYHSINGLSLILRRYGFNALAKNRLLRTSIFSLGAVVAVIALLSFGGNIHTINNPLDNDYAKAYSEIMGLDLQELKK